MSVRCSDRPGAACIARRLAWLAVLVLGSACYRDVPVERPRPGMELRARLRVEAAVRRSGESGELVRQVSGSLVAVRGDTLLLDVPVARGLVGLQEVVLRDTVALGRSEIEALFERRVALGRTALVAAGLVAGTVAVASGIRSVAGGEPGEEPEDGGAAAATVPVLGAFRWVGLRFWWPPR